MAQGQETSPTEWGDPSGMGSMAIRRGAEHRAPLPFLDHRLVWNYCLAMMPINIGAVPATDVISVTIISATPELMVASVAGTR